VVLLSSAAALAVGGPSRGSDGEIAAVAAPPEEHARRAHRDMGRLMTMDHHLVRADFIGEVTVLAIQSREDGGAEVEVQVDDTWSSRWTEAQTLTITIADWGSFAGLVEEKARLVVLLSGGAWTSSPFTFQANSVFRVADDDMLRCISKNPLFAVHNSGFICSIQEYMPSAPLSLKAMRDETIAMRDRAAMRLPALEEALDRLERPLVHEPAPPIEKDAIDAEVSR
jgi:hypothetical protein